MKNKSKYCLMLLVYLTVSMPLQAEVSILDSYTSKLKQIAEEAKKKLQDYYGSNKESSTKTNTPVINPVAPSSTNNSNSSTNSIDPLKEKFSRCSKFLGYFYSVNNENDPKKIATIYLNASLDYFTTNNYDKKLSDSEIAERNKCVKLALTEGADPDSTGKDTVDETSIIQPSKPLALAVKNENLAAVKMLLDYKANPNIKDIGIGKETPLLNLAMNFYSSDISLELINAGADVSSPSILWMAASNANDKIVQVLIDKRVPVNQLVKFTSYDDKGQTALDSSEYRLNSLDKYLNEIATNSKLTIQEKILEANSVLYYSYPLMPQLNAQENVNPDEFMKNLHDRQQRISNLLKDAGGVCNEENCGIIILSN